MRKIVFLFGLVLFSQLTFSQIEKNYRSSSFYLNTKIIGLSEHKNMYIQVDSTLWKMDLNTTKIEQLPMKTSKFGNFGLTKDEKHIIEENRTHFIVWKNNKLHKKWSKTTKEGMPNRLVANQQGNEFAYSSKNTLQIWNAESGKLLHEMSLEKTIQTLYFTPDGNYLIVGTEGCDLLMWDIKKQKINYQITLDDCQEARGIIALASYQNKHLLAGIRHENIRLLDFQTGKELKRFNMRDVKTLAFDQSGQFFYAGSFFILTYANKINLQTGEIQELDDAMSGFETVVISPHFDYWMICGDGLSFWDKKTDTKVLELLFQQDRDNRTRDRKSVV